MELREFDVVLYGATGFVGRQTAAYLAQRGPEIPLRWAIAARNADKLQRLHEQLELPGSVAVIQADSSDLKAIDGMVARARVVLNTAGPFALYGDPVVAACVRRRTDYVDITGETPWVRTLIDRYDAQARADGTCIVPCCGFDSIPSDLGVLLAVRGLERTCGAACGEAATYFQLRGGLNGGTLASAFHMLDSGQQQQARDPFLLNVPQKRTPHELSRNGDPRHAEFDSRIGSWVGPFFMSYINTRVVRRSAELWHEAGRGYGPQFHYQEYLKYGAEARARAKWATGGMALAKLAMKSRVTRRVLERFLPAPGSGPTEQSMNAGWFRSETLALAADGRQVIVRMRFAGDPGNRATVRMVAESALCLATREPGQPAAVGHGGVLTAATALGESLVPRLQRAGMVFEGPLSGSDE